MIHQAKSNPQLLDEQIFSERIASAISAMDMPRQPDESAHGTKQPPVGPALASQGWEVRRPVIAGDHDLAVDQERLRL